MRYRLKDSIWRYKSYKLDRGKRYGLIGANGAREEYLFENSDQAKFEPTSGNACCWKWTKSWHFGAESVCLLEDFTLKDAVLYGQQEIYMMQLRRKKSFMESGDFDDV